MRRPGNERSLERKVRNSYAISTVSIALVLFLLGGVGYLIMGAMKVSDSVRENITLYVALRGGVSDEQTAGVGVRLRDMPQVREVKYVSKEEAAASFREEIGSDFENFLNFNPLPDTYEVKLHAQFSRKESLVGLEETIAGWDEVGEVFYQRSVAEQIGSNLSRFNLVLLFFGGALLVIALILLNNTIRLTIYSKRYLINTMKLVGATKWFIKKPFIVRSIVQGLLAWFIAAVMFILLVAGIARGLPEMVWLTERNPVVIILTAMLLLSLLISVLFTNFAVNKFVRMNSSEIHLY
jgi:cell division transport system permease protein